MNELNVHDLFARYLDRQTAAARDGLGFPDLGDATPHDMTPVQPIDPRLAWDDATAAGRLLGPATAFTAPADWPALANQQEPAVAVAFALGNYPQQVRHIHALLTGTPLAVRQGGEAPARPDLIAWANARPDDAGRLLAAGVLRLARQFDAAAELLAARVAPEWETVRLNELAALAWHRGEADAALELWRKLPPSAPVSFNVGLALLFSGQAAEAAPHLRRAADGLPESSPWHHLAGLYLALASAQG
jgi:tetratricopeptide (TPR) repeat protein